jgi:hypothetical protein
MQHFILCPGTEGKPSMLVVTASKPGIEQILCRCGREIPKMQGKYFGGK